MKILTIKAHLEFAPLVSVGDKVTPHTMLGIAGNTGYSDGYHLHISVKKFNKEKGLYEVIDPRHMFPNITFIDER